MHFFAVKNTCRLLSVTGLFFISLHTAAQTKKDSLDAARLLQPVYSPNWLLIKEGVSITDQQFISNHKSLLQLKADDGLQLLKTETDAYGFTHNRYNRLYKNYPVAGKVMLFHSRGSQLQSVNGDMDIVINAVVPLINFSREQIISRARQFFPSEKYAWEIAEMEKSKKEMLRDAKATYYPEAPLVWQLNAATNQYELCYQVDIVTQALEAKRLFITADKGQLIYNYFLSTSCTATSTPTIFYGTRTMHTMYTNLPGIGTRYYLWNNCSPAFIRTREMFAGDTTDYYTISNVWALYISAATSHWGVQQAAAYFSTIHGRQSWNNNNAGTYVHNRPYYNNAGAWHGNITIGEGNANGSSDDWNSLDITAHEYAHMVTQTSAALEYSKESGALNESFSDIFGVACYQNNFGFNSNIWKVCYDRTDVSNANTHLFIRDMANPNSMQDPHTYQGNHWVNTNLPENPGDDWGVHTNSGVQNFMFYLLVTGGSGTNDNGLQYSVGGIGIVDARRIAYQALTAYLTISSNHTDARNAWVQAARNIFGECSNQAIQTGRAWDAVGLPPPDRLYNYVGNFTGVYNIVSSAGTATLSTPNPFTVQPGAQVTVGARRVRILPGFRANAGAYFRAYNNDCFYAAL